jgi:Fe-S-cluster containining protein
MRLPAGDQQLVQIVDAAFADAVLRAGDFLACCIGCTQCCHGAFAINALDAARLRAGMAALRAKAHAAAQAVEERARAWVGKYGSDFPGDAASGLLGTSDADSARFEEFANDAPCPALDLATGRCDVYAWRPMTCRVFGPPIRMARPDAVGMVDVDAAEGLGHCELCFSGATHGEVAAHEMPIPHELEARLVAEIGSIGETVVAFALLR